MKKILYLILGGVVSAGSFCSCNYLDKQPDNILTPPIVWETKSDAEAYLYNIYGHIGLPSDDHAALGCADDTSMPIEGLDARRIVEGNWNPSYPVGNYWQHYYAAIRRTIIFENSIDLVPDAVLSKELKTRYKAESKFLRGWFYWLTLRLLGPFIIVDTPLSINDDYSSYKRAPFDKCVEHLCGILKEAAEVLPDEWVSPAEYGRPTKGACLAVIAEARLLAAGELWNGNPGFADFKNHDGEQLAPLTYDPNKWKIAAEAAREVIYLDKYHLFRNTDEGDPLFDPYLSFRNLFLTNWNDEIVFATCMDWAWGYEKRCAPVPGGYSIQNATQNIVDAFYTRNGLDKDDDPEYTEIGFATQDDPANYGFSRDQFNRGYLAGESNMYVNREPRFYASVQYNGRPVLPAPTVDDKNFFSSEINRDGRGRAEYYFSGLSGTSNLSSDFTGYNVLKKISPGSNIRIDQVVYRPFIHLRYAQVLLNYIEALNEYDPSHPDIIAYFNEIRDRAGIPNISATYPSEIGDKEKMRDRILRERFIELAFEGDRYYTLCRRRLFEKAEYRTIQRMNVLANDYGEGFAFEGFYQRQDMPLRYWHDKMYLFPINQTEMDKAHGLVQNPGW